jgi:hypothetical protein
MSELTKTTVYLPAGVYRSLKALARRQARPAAELLREAVSEYARRHDRARKPASLGAGRSGHPNLSERAEELLAGMGRRH